VLAEQHVSGQLTHTLSEDKLPRWKLCSARLSARHRPGSRLREGIHPERLP
jgi:hypothetical protein